MDLPLDRQPLDEQGLRALTHPLRLRLLGLLRREGPATATGLATRTQESSGLTSYHLRQLAEAGLVVDAPGGTGRERRWQAAARSSSFDPRTADPELGAHFQRTVVHRLTDDALRWVDSEDAWSDEWRGAAGLNDYDLDLDAAQARALVGELQAVLERYRGRPAAGARPVSVQLHLFPIGPPPDLG